MFLSFQKNQKIVKWSNALNDFCSVKIYLAKKDKNNLINVQFSKNYVGLISLSQLSNT